MRTNADIQHTLVPNSEAILIHEEGFMAGVEHANQEPQAEVEAGP
jgi:hypothetical protein